MRPCVEPGCGELSEHTRCLEHTRPRTHELSSTDRGYDSVWHRLSKRARKLQPWCSDCLGTTDLTTDHTERAWARKAAGKSIRLRDVDVLCRSCNAKRGAARVSSTPRGIPPSGTPFRPAGGTKSRFVSTSRDFGGV